jgi:hypothetical protein
MRCALQFSSKQSLHLSDDVFMMQSVKQWRAAHMLPLPRHSPHSNENP